MESIKLLYKPYVLNRTFIYSTFFSVFFLALAMLVNFQAGLYATEKASNSVTDLVLDNIPVFHLDGTFVYGAFLLWVFFGIICIKNPRIIPFSFNSVALFTLIRSFFISLTHIGPSPAQIPIDVKYNLLEKFTPGGDLFFSGHTGLPFLLALIFWDNFKLRIIFLSASLFFGAVVLLGHLHYSIDVVAAFFITYTIFHIAEILFKKDRKIFFSGVGKK